MIRTRRKAAGRGFTVMEVMVAVLLLAVAVVSIFGAQFTAVATVDYSRYATTAIQLARCRMSEIELEVVTEGGFEEGDVSQSGDCCEAMEGEENVDLFNCRWELKTVELPDISALLGGGADGGVLGGLDPMGGGAAGIAGGMGMAASFLPMISEVLRQAMRRVTVKVQWDQGVKQREFALSQYLVHPTQGPLQLMHSAMAADALLEEGLMGVTGEDGAGDVRRRNE